MFACYLDASNAFDRVNHWTLFNKLVKRGVPRGTPGKHIISLVV